MQFRVRTATALCLAFLAAACTTAAKHAEQLPSVTERQMTLGTVQKEIRAGLTQDQVIAALGSPNLVTRDAQGRETWVYDKVASEAAYSSSGAYGTVLLAGASSAAGASSRTERSLTVTIKFGADQRVDTFSYHSSRF
jgi:outer membrane protein assembly factor BamE (lipoprotein component of BamABCDE complex)